MSRPIWSILLIWLAPAVALVESAFAVFLGHWRAVGDIEHGMLALFALWLTGALALRSPAFRHRLGTLWREILLLAVVVGIGWSGLEVGAHLINASLRPDAPFHTRGPYIQFTRHLESQDVPGITGTSHFTTGPRGIRAATPPTPRQTRRVLCIGGSTTECVYLDDTETWPALLEKQVSGALDTDRLWIGNVGISGFYTRDHMGFVEHSPLLKKTAALVVQPGINDLWRFLAGEEFYTRFDRFEPVSQAQSEAQEPAAPPPQPYRPLWSRSRVIQLFHTLRAEPPPLEAQEGIGGIEYRIRREKRAEATLVDVLPDLTKGLENYGERIQAIIDLCKNRRVPVLFTTQPVLWRDDLPPEIAALCWFGWLEDGNYLTLGALRQAMDRYNETLMETCRAASVPCVNLSSMNGNPAYFYDDCHFTEAGAVEVAAQVAPALADLLGPTPVD